MVARDECNATRINVSVRHESAPVVAEGQVLAVDEALRVTGSVLASDAEGDPLSFAIVGGSGAGVFSIDPASGALEATADLDLDSASYTLLVTASDGRLTSEPASVLVTLPARVTLCLGDQTLQVRRSWVPVGLDLGAQLGACEPPEESLLARLGRWLEGLLGRLG